MYAMVLAELKMSLNLSEHQAITVKDKVRVRVAIPRKAETE